MFGTLDSYVDLSVTEDLGERRGVSPPVRRIQTCWAKGQFRDASCETALR